MRPRHVCPIVLIYIMDPREHLKSIQAQKHRLKQRITDINNTDVASSPSDQQELQQLLLRKKILQDQRAKQQQYLQLEQEYLQRRKQAERERELQRVKNEKRMLELQAAMKKVVFQGIKEKVKGINSHQLMMRGYLAQGVEGEPGKEGASAGGFKDAFEGYLLEQPPAKDKPTYDLNKLNEQRLQLFQRKEEVVMRQILLKELAASDEPIEMDVLGMTRDQLEAQLRKREVELDDFMHPVRKQDVIEHYPSIKEQAEQRINEKKRGVAQQRAQREAYQKLKRQLREDVNGLPFKSVQVVKRLLFDLIDEICDGYDKRHVGRSPEDQDQVARKLQQEYEELWNRNLVQQLSQNLLQEMLREATQQMRKEAAEEVARLNELAHLKTEDCFRGVLGDGEVRGRIEELSGYKLPLVFVSEEENNVNKPRNDQYMKKLDNTEENVFETETSTVSLVNDIQLLSEEEKYLKSVKAVAKNQQQAKNEDSVFLYDKALYAVNRNGIRLPVSGKPVYSFSKPIDGVVRANKLNKNWLIESENAVVLVTPWNREEIGSPIGARISNPCGTITSSCLYPVLTFMGSPCSLLVGFEKGQLLKYNPNLNRISSRQTTLTHYTPVIEHAKTGDQPPFPLQNRDFIPVQPEKATKPTDEAHEFRQFFEHHSEAIVFVEFYRVDRVITVDRGLHCALWEYGKGRGTASFEPLFKFSLRCSYQVYREDENPRYKDIFPTADSKESPEQMYQKYLQTESFLKLQLYNNPKKEMAYLRGPGWQGQQGEKAIWKVTYKEQRRQVHKILQSYYNVAEGSVSAEMARLHQDTLYLLCYRDHPIRTDLKTVKLYSWSIGEKRLGRVAIELDMYKEQRVSGLAVVGAGQSMKGVDMEVAVVANSGRLLLFSLVSGQLLKNVNDQLPGQRLYFKTLLPALDQGFYYAIASNALLELHLQDLNTPNDRNKLNKTIDAVKRKFFR